MARSASPHPKPPAPAEIDAAAKKRLLAAIKTVLARLQQRGAVPAGLDYAAILGKPAALKAFVDAFKADPTIAADIAVDAAGRPVRGEDELLVCGLSLAQVRQMLVYTCAKRVFTEAEPPTPPAPAGKPPPKSEGERKLAALEPLLAFEWQLPLLKFYYFFLDRHQLAELGPDLLLLRRPEQLEIVSSFDATRLRQARRNAAGGFVELLQARPEAIGGVARARPDDFAFFRRVLGPATWAFYARDEDFVDDVGELDRDRVEAMGPVLAGADAAAVQALAKLDPDRIAQLLAGFRQVFGDHAAGLFAEPAFARQVLAPLVERFKDIADTTAERFTELVVLKSQALRPVVAQWLDRGKRG